MAPLIKPRPASGPGLAPPKRQLPRARVSGHFHMLGQTRQSTPVVTPPATPTRHRGPMSEHTEPRPTRAGRHRDHQRPARPHAVLVRLSAEEYQAIQDAATRTHLTATGFTAKAALASATASTGPESGQNAAALRDLQGELFAARRAVNMLASNVNQAAAAYNSTGTLPDWISEAVTLCRSAVERLDQVTGRIHRRLR
jgi:hypothetical protein